MAIIETSRPVPFGAVSTLRIVNVFDSLRTAIVAAYKANKTEVALGKLSNAQLDDIGLVRAHIHAVAMRTAHM